MLVKCIGKKDRKNLSKCILRILEPLELKGKIAFPVNFIPELNKEYLCEIVKNYPRYCFVKLHEHRFEKFELANAFVNIEPLLLKLRVSVELTYTSKCICGEVKCKNEEFSIDIEPSNRGLEKAKRFIESLNLSENIKQKMIKSLTKEFKEKINIVYIYPNDGEKLLKVYEKKALEIARKARYPYWKIDVLKKSLDETKYRAQLLGDGQKLLEVIYKDVWYDGFGKKYEIVPPTTRNDFLLFYVIITYFIPFIKVKTKNEFEKALESIKPLTEEEKKIKKVFELWEKEVFKKRKKIVVYELKIKMHNPEETITVRTLLPSKLLNIKVCYEKKIAVGEEPAWLLPDTVYTTLLVHDKKAKPIIEEKEIETTINEVSELCQKMKYEMRVRTGSGRIIIIKPK